MKLNKTFNIWQYNNCAFEASHYIADSKAIAIRIVDNETSEAIVKCTTYIQNVEYKEGIATIKNYSENRGMTDFLKEMGIVTEVVESFKCNEDAEDTETIDVCKIDLKKLKEYARDWHYEERKN